jgi:hypothetical protein
MALRDQFLIKTDVSFRSEAEMGRMAEHAASSQMRRNTDIGSAARRDAEDAFARFLNASRPSARAAYRLSGIIPFRWISFRQQQPHQQRGGEGHCRDTQKSCRRA